MNTPSKTQDELYMQTCFELALQGAGSVEPNPMVGAIIVHQERIIGRGYHEKFGAAHAEINAINSVSPTDRVLLSESSIYISLEPCFHFGKTPPCVNAIIQHAIPKVVISCLDPNPKVNGKSVAKLRILGVKVITGVLVKEGKTILAEFLKQF